MNPPTLARFMARTTPTRQSKTILLVFSHLRWNFVFQRPQHLFTRAAKTQPVIFFEEPVYEGATRAHLRLAQPQDNITVATPVLPRGLTQNEADLSSARFSAISWRATTSPTASSASAWSPGTLRRWRSASPRT